MNIFFAPARRDVARAGFFVAALWGGRGTLKHDAAFARPMAPALSVECGVQSAELSRRGAKTLRFPANPIPHSTLRIPHLKAGGVCAKRPPELKWQPLMEPGSGGAITDVSVCPWNSRRVLVAGDMLGVGLSLDRGDSWSATFGFQTWEMASFTWHPSNKNEVWVGSMSGPYKSVDGGAHWESKRAGMFAPVNFGYSVPIEKVVFDPNNSRHLLAIAGSSRHWDFTGHPVLGIVWSSLDGGDSWTRLSSVERGDPSAEWGVGSAELSRRGSATSSPPANPIPHSALPTPHLEGVNITWIGFAPGSSSLVYACADEVGFLASTDGGRSWTKRNGGLPLTDHRIALHPSDPNILWASVDNTLQSGASGRTPGGIWKTTDGGLHWNPSSVGLGQIVNGFDPNLSSRYRALTVAPSNPLVLYCNDSAYSTGIGYKSEDGGATWRPVVSKNNLGFPSAEWGVRNAELGASKARLSPLVANSIPHSALPTPHLDAVFQLATACPAGLAWAGVAVDPHDPNACYGFSTESIARSLDGGKTWNDATSVAIAEGKRVPRASSVEWGVGSAEWGVRSAELGGLEGSPQGTETSSLPANSIPHSALLTPHLKHWRGRGFSGWVSTNFKFNPFKAGQSLWQGMDAARAWVSSDNLKSWTQTLREPDAWNGGRDASFARDGTIFVTSGTYSFTGISRSRDGGATWTVLHGRERGLPEFYAGGAPGGVFVSPDNSQRVWTVVNDKLLASTDGGDSWTLALDKPGLRWLANDPKRPERLFVSGERNIYFSDDGHNFLALGGPHTRDCTLAVDSAGRLLVAAAGGERPGLWRCEIPSERLPVRSGECGVRNWVGDELKHPRFAAKSIPHSALLTPHLEGAQWTRLSDEKAIGGVAVDPLDPKRLVFSTDQNPFTEKSAASGLYFSGDDGVSWSAQNEGLAMLRGGVVAFDPFTPGRVVFGSGGRGFWTTNWPKNLKLAATRAFRSSPDDAAWSAVRAASPPPIALVNGDMEASAAPPAGTPPAEAPPAGTPPADGVPKGWSRAWVGSGDIEVSRDTVQKHGGAASLHVQSTGDSKGQAAQLLDGAPGTTFTLSGWLKTAGAVQVNVYVQSFKSDWQPVENGFQQAGFGRGTSDWTYFEKTLTLPADVAHFGTGLLLEGNGSAWLDDVQITEVQLPPVEP